MGSRPPLVDQVDPPILGRCSTQPTGDLLGSLPLSVPPLRVERSIPGSARRALRRPTPTVVRLMRGPPRSTPGPSSTLRRKGRGGSSVGNRDEEPPSAVGFEFSPPAHAPMRSFGWTPGRWTALATIPQLFSSAILLCGCDNPVAAVSEGLTSVTTDATLLPPRDHHAIAGPQRDRLRPPERYIVGEPTYCRTRRAPRQPVPDPLSRDQPNLYSHAGERVNADSYKYPSRLRLLDFLEYLQFRKQFTPAGTLSTTRLTTRANNAPATRNLNLLSSSFCTSI